MFNIIIIIINNNETDLWNVNKTILIKNTCLIKCLKKWHAVKKSKRRGRGEMEAERKRNCAERRKERKGKIDLHLSDMQTTRSVSL